MRDGLIARLEEEPIRGRPAVQRDEEIRVEPLAEIRTPILAMGQRDALDEQRPELGAVEGRQQTPQLGLAHEVGGRQPHGLVLQPRAEPERHVEPVREPIGDERQHAVPLRSLTASPPARRRQARERSRGRL